MGPWNEIDESDEDDIAYHPGQSEASVVEAIAEMDVGERSVERSVKEGSDGPVDDELPSTSAEKQPSKKKRKRDVEQEEEKNVLPYRTRSRRRASMEAKKRVFRPRQKRQ
jgi:hypothetical protein